METVVPTRRLRRQKTTRADAASRTPTHPNIPAGIVKGSTGPGRKKTASSSKARRRITRPTPYAEPVSYKTVLEYWEHFLNRYCLTPVTTFDGVSVTFEPNGFGHAFYEGEFKQTFSCVRAERIDWIEKALKDQSAELYQGYDKLNRRPTKNRRVCLVNKDYVVVIKFVSASEAHFITAYIASDDRRQLLRRSPRWRCAREGPSTSISPAQADQVTKPREQDHVRV